MRSPWHPVADAWRANYGPGSVLTYPFVDMLERRRRRPKRTKVKPGRGLANKDGKP